jgi:hypothetical protein
MTEKRMTLVTGVSSGIGQATATAKTQEIPSAQAWFAGGERIGYDSNSRAIVQAQGAPLNVFLRQEGDLAHAVSFLPGKSA